MQRLKCCHQEYDWGKLGAESSVGTIVNAGQHFDGRKKERHEFNPKRPHAELWMGTHQNGPSFIYDEKTGDIASSLKDFLQKNEHGDYDLPFLFKCLSVRKALSIQTHPTKEQAKVLYARDPKNYPDDNHKPEMAIAVTEFEVLCGFAPWEEITANLAAFPEARKLSGDHPSENNEQELSETFSSIWKSSPADIAACVQSIVARISSKEKQSELEKLMIRLDGQFPGGDVGVLAPIFLNHLVLKPGESVYLGANVPHAYLFGDCIECMACSDNTIRAGLTPKFKDVDTLCSAMNWSMGAPPFVDPAIEPVHDSARRLYSIVGQSEFMIRKWESALAAQKGSVYVYHPATGTNSIWVILRGSGTFVQDGEHENISVKAGDVILKPTSSEAILLANPDFLAYSALVPNAEKPSEAWESPRMQQLAAKVQKTFESLHPDQQLPNLHEL